MRSTTEDAYDEVCIDLLSFMSDYRSSSRRYLEVYRVVQNDTNTACFQIAEDTNPEFVGVDVC